MWKCENCDTENEDHLMLCEVCQTPRTPAPVVSTLGVPINDKTRTLSQKIRELIGSVLGLLLGFVVVGAFCVSVLGVASGLSIFSPRPDPTSPRYVPSIVYATAVDTSIISQIFPSFTPHPKALPPSPTIQSPSPACTKVLVSVKSTSGGTLLQITPCIQPLYNLGPFPNGVYKVSSSNKFIVYVAMDADGSVYISRIGDTAIAKLGALKQDYKFAAFFKDETPSYRLTLSEMWLTIYEEKFKNSASYEIPSKYSR